MSEPEVPPAQPADVDATPPGEAGFTEALGGVPAVGMADADRRVSLRRPGPKSYLEWWGTTFMAVLLGAIILLCMMLAIVWMASRPTMSDVVEVLGPAATTAPANGGADGSAHLQMLEKLQRTHFEQFRDLFQVLVLSGLVPLFTLIAGYVFGRVRSARAPASEQDIS